MLFTSFVTKMGALIVLFVSFVTMRLGVSMERTDELSLPMLDDMKAILTANIDGTKLNNHIKHVTEKEVDKRLNAVIYNVTNTVNGVKVELENTNREILQMEHFTDELNALKKTVSQLEKEQMILQQKCNQNEVEIGTRKVPSSTPAKYGFTATRKNAGAVKNHEVIVFNNLITNIGSVYDPSTGIFTAHEDGVYVFFFNLECSENNGDTYGQLFRDGTSTTIEVYCHGFGDYDNSATMGVLSLNAGNRVWVKHITFDSVTKSFGGKTIFSGFMI